MQNFLFQNSTRILFGARTHLQVGKEISRHTDKVLLHYGSGSIKKTGLYDQIVQSLNESQIEFIELAGVQPNPRLSMVRKGIELCREHKIGFILAVGGGSPIDSAKAIAAGVPYPGDVWDFFSGKRIEKALKLGVVLTIPAAGSESSDSSVITKEEGWYKRAIGSNLLRPVFSIMNPELTFTLPPYQTAAGITDMIAHILERYFTTERNVDLTDRLCEATLKCIIHNTPKVLKEPGNYDARAEIMWSGTIAHNGLLGTGRISDWATHGIEHELSGIYDITHGAGLAIIFPAWMKYVYQAMPERFMQYAYRVWDVEPGFFSNNDMINEGIVRTKQFFSSIGMPVSLTEAGIDPSRLEEMAQKCTENGPLGSFMPLHKQDVLNILQTAL